MSLDVFSRGGQEFGGAISADAARVLFSGVIDDSGAVGLIVQQLSVQYQQQVTRVYEVGTDKTFYIAGRTRGDATLSRVMGPRPIAVGFYARFGNVCNAAQNIINFSIAAGCNVGETLSQQNYIVKHAVITQLGFQVNAQDMMINEQVAMTFAALNPG